MYGDVSMKPCHLPGGHTADRGSCLLHTPMVLSICLVCPPVRLVRCKSPAWICTTAFLQLDAFFAMSPSLRRYSWNASKESRGGKIVFARSLQRCSLPPVSDYRPWEPWEPADCCRERAVWLWSKSGDSGAKQQRALSGSPSFIVAIIKRPSPPLRLGGDRYRAV